jgi:hypothetical protein
MSAFACLIRIIHKGSSQNRPKMHSACSINRYSRETRKKSRTGRKFHLRESLLSRTSCLSRSGFTRKSSAFALAAETSSIIRARSLSDIDRSTAANDPRPSASCPAQKNPQCVPASTPPVFPGLRPRIWPHLLRLVTKAM